MHKLSIVMVSLASVSGVAAAGSGSGDASGAAMKAPAEIAAMAKEMGGTLRCKGQAVGHDMKTMVDMTGTWKGGKLESDNWWVHETFDSAMGKEKYHFDSYVTYDPGSKKWRRVMIETGGGYSVGDSTGMTGGKLDWDMTSNSPMGQAMFRDHIDASDAKAGVKTWGELSLDKGKTWTKIYEQTCKK